MNTTSAITVLVGATELEVNAIFTIKMKIIVTLNQSIGKFSIRNARAAFDDAFLNELAVKELSHGKDFADFAEKIKVFYIFEPVEII